MVLILDGTSMFDIDDKKQEKNLKMLQVNAVDHGGRLNINVKKKGFTPTEAIGVLEVAKQQLMAGMAAGPGAPGKDKEGK